MSPTPQTPDGKPVRLGKSLLTGLVYAVTDYEQADDGSIQAIVKHDVTSDYRAMADAEHAARQLLDDPVGQAAGREPGQQLDEVEEVRLREVIRAATAQGVHSDTIDTPVDLAKDETTGGAGS